MKFFLQNHYLYIFFKHFVVNNFMQRMRRVAIQEIVVTLRQLYDDDTEDFLNKKLGHHWTVNHFWETIDTRFSSEDDSVIQELIWVREIQFDLETI